MKKLLYVLLTAFSPSILAAVERPLTLDTATGSVYGTLTLPDTAGSYPVAVIIAGSGPTDRDGNSAPLPGKNNSLQMLATVLADAGIASLRYDKRGIAASAQAGQNEADIRFEHYVEDASAWLEKLEQDSRFTGFAVIGHSEGSLIGMLAAQQHPQAVFVSIAGPAEGAADVLRQQLKAQLPPELAAQNETILSMLEQGQTASEVPAPLMALYRPSVQPYLISWIRYVPTAELVKLDTPCLILQGDTDIQVNVAASEALRRARPACELKVVTGMNHVMKLVPDNMQQQIASYSDPALPLAPELAVTLTQFLTDHLREP